MGSLVESNVEPIENTKRVEMMIVASSKSINQFRNSFDVRGFKLPMVPPPALWDENIDGGYLLNNNLHFDELIHQGNNNLIPTKINNKDSIYGQINYMSKIPF